MSLGPGCPIISGNNKDFSFSPSDHKCCVISAVSALNQVASCLFFKMKLYFFSLIAFSGALLTSRRGWKNESGWICGSVYLKLRSAISKPMQQYCSNYQEYYLGISIAWQLQKNDLLNTRCENHLHFPFNVSSKELSCCPRRPNNTQALWTFKNKSLIYFTCELIIKF